MCEVVSQEPLDLAQLINAAQADTQHEQQPAQQPDGLLDQDPEAGADDNFEEEEQADLNDACSSVQDLQQLAADPMSLLSDALNNMAQSNNINGNSSMHSNSNTIGGFGTRNSNNSNLFLNQNINGDNFKNSFNTNMNGVDGLINGLSNNNMNNGQPNGLINNHLNMNNNNQLHEDSSLASCSRSGSNSPDEQQQLLLGGLKQKLLMCQIERERAQTELLKAQRRLIEAQLQGLFECRTSPLTAAGGQVKAHDQLDPAALLDNF